MILLTCHRQLSQGAQSKGFKMKKMFALWTVLLMSAVAIAASAPPPAPVTTVVVSGRSLLADSKGMTVYVFDNDKTSSSTCYTGCSSFWPALTVQPTDTVAAPFGKSNRTDGTVQPTLNNRPLYRYAGDHNSGDTHGDGLGGIWHVVPF